jgi:hypothetical protein
MYRFEVDVMDRISLSEYVKNVDMRDLNSDSNGVISFSSYRPSACVGATSCCWFDSSLESMKSSSVGGIKFSWYN